MRCLLIKSILSYWTAPQLTCPVPPCPGSNVRDLYCLLRASRTYTFLSDLRKQRPNNTSFRQALDLSTSPCDLHKFHNIRLFIRQQIDKHYDYSLPYMLQTATTVATFEAEVSPLFPPMLLPFLIISFNKLNAVLPELYSTEWRKKQTSHYVETHFRNSLWLMQRDLQSKAKNVEDDNESTSSITSADSTAVSEVCRLREYCA